MNKLILIVALLIAGPCYALDLETAIDNAAIKYKLNPDLLHAIAFIESSSSPAMQVKFNTNGTIDLGPFQINSVHWQTTCKAYKVYELQGNANCAAKILKRLSKFSLTDPLWYGRYHSKTPHLKLKYAKKIKDFLNKSDKIE